MTQLVDGFPVVFARWTEPLNGGYLRVRIVGPASAMAKYSKHLLWLDAQVVVGFKDCRGVLPINLKGSRFVVQLPPPPPSGARSLYVERAYLVETTQRGNETSGQFARRKTALRDLTWTVGDARADLARRTDLYAYDDPALTERLFATLDPLVHCPICYHVYKDGVTTMLTCGHVICVSCWTAASRASNKCPTCRQPQEAGRVFRCYAVDEFVKAFRAWSSPHVVKGS
jgi:hypothetical protein